MPNGAVVVVEPRQLELQRTPVRVKDEVKQSILVRRFNGDRQAVRRVAPVGLIQLDAVPDSLRFPELLNEALALTLAVQGATQAPLAEQADEPVQVRMFLKQRPIEPTRFIVLTVGVVVAVLTPADFVPHNNQRDAERKHGGRDEVPDLSVTKPLNG